MTDTRPTFYYANGTAFFVPFLGTQLGPLSSPGTTLHVEGVFGEFYEWDGTITTDPFPQLLDSTLWKWKRVEYPATALDMAASIQHGVDWVVDQIIDTAGPFALGGYSQGAAVMSKVYDECRQGRLVDRRGDLRAIVNFGNPMRETGKTFKGSSGYAGAFDIENSTTGSHGCFPVRLQNTEDFVYEFVMPNEVITGVGDSPAGKLWVSAAGNLLNRNLAGALFDIIAAIAGTGDPLIDFINAVGNLLTKLFNAVAGALSTAAGVAYSALPGLGESVLDLVSAAAGAVTATDPYTLGTINLAGGGHVLYPFMPPPNADGSAGSGDTCYQIAAKYLNAVGAQIYAQINPSVPIATGPPSYAWFSSLPA